MKAGFVVLLIFATAWAVGGMYAAGAQPAFMAIPVGVSAGLLVAARRSFEGQISTPETARRIRRLVAVWSAVEVVLILVAVNLLARAGKPMLIGPTVCIIVGLHFIPLARGLPQGVYYATAGAMIAAGAIGAALPAPSGSIFMMFVAALILWATALTIMGKAARHASEARSQSG